MHILFFSREYTTHDRRYLASLVEAGHRVSYLRLERGATAYETRPVPEGVRTIPWAGGRGPFTLRMWPRLLLDLRRVLRELRPDLVHAGPVQSCGFLAAAAGATPLVVMSWGSDVLVEAARNPAMRWITRYTLRRADMVIGDCRAVREKVRALSGLPDDRIVTYPWGIELGTFRPRPSALDLRRRLGWDRAQVFLSTRSWEPPYQIEVLIEAFHRVARRSDAARLVLLGDGSMAGRIRTMIGHGGLADRIHVAGQVPQDLLPEYYNLADVYVSSVPQDGTSISLLEAMACGLPVIVADAPGNREWVAEGRNGWLFRAGDPEALASAMLAALAPSAGTEEIRRANLALARAEADWSRNVTLLLAAYARATRRGQAAGVVTSQPG